MKTKYILIVCVLFVTSVLANAATNDVATLLQQGLLEEEANHQLDAAIGDYKEAIKHFDGQRQLAATAIFRLGECYRKQGHTNEANAQYARIVREFPDQAELAQLSQAYLPTGGTSAQTQVLPSDEENFLRQVRETMQNSPDLVNQQLTKAIAAGYASAAEFLLTHGADVNRKAPIAQAANLGNDAMIRLLLNHGAAVDARDGGRTALHCAAENGFLTICRTLLAHGADVNAQYNNGWTPLHAAVTKMNLPLVELFITNKAQVNATNSDGQTPLFVAIQLQNVDIAKLLLDNHADANMGAFDRLSSYWLPLSPLDRAVYSDNPEMVKLLLEHHADPNALTLPIPGYFKISFRLPSKSSDVELGAGETPLMWTASLNQLHATRIVQLLLDHGATPNETDPDGQTALVYAIRTKNIDVCRALIARGADVNALDTQGRPPLAHTKKDSQIEEVLIKAGADPDYNRRRGIWSCDSEEKPKTMVFSCPTNFINHHTLLEFIARSCPPFPDFARVSIHRLNGKRAEVVPVNVADFFQTGDCAKDVALQPGDMVEIPEREHKVAENWAGFLSAEEDALNTCLFRMVRIIVKGTTNDVAVEWRSRFHPPGSVIIINGKLPDWKVKALKERKADIWVESVLLNTVVHQANVLLNTSDLSRVHLTRGGAKMTFDLTTKTPPEVWLEDGDVIEIPELGQAAPAATTK